VVLDGKALRGSQGTQWVGAINAQSGLLEKAQHLLPEDFLILYFTDETRTTAL
jgi:hypothetical protein